MSRGQTLRWPPHSFQTIFRVSCSHCSHCSHLAPPAPGNTQYPARSSHSPVTGQRSSQSVSRCYRWGEDVTRPAPGISHHSSSKQRIIVGAKGVNWSIETNDTLGFIRKNLKKINVQMESFICPRGRLSFVFSVSLNFCVTSDNILDIM